MDISGIIGKYRKILSFVPPCYGFGIASVKKPVLARSCTSRVQFGFASAEYNPAAPDRLP
jgi:hypothetical protein